MAGRTRKKTEKPTVARPNIQKAILKSVEKLYGLHGAEIEEIQNESEQRIISFGFSIRIDCSEAEPIVKTSIRIPSTITDSTTARLEDENQGGFQFLSEVDGTDESEGDEPTDKETEVEVKA